MVASRSGAHGSSHALLGKHRREYLAIGGESLARVAKSRPRFCLTGLRWHSSNI